MISHLPLRLESGKKMPTSRTASTGESYHFITATSANRRTLARSLACDFLGTLPYEDPLGRFFHAIQALTLYEPELDYSSPRRYPDTKSNSAREGLMRLIAHQTTSYHLTFQFRVSFRGLINALLRCPHHSKGVEVPSAEYRGDTSNIKTTCMQASQVLQIRN